MRTRMGFAFPRPSALFEQSRSASLVHVLDLSADERLVGFKFRIGTTHFRLCAERPIVQSPTNPMEHEPCGLLGNAKHLRQFVRRNATLARDQHPHCRHPLIKTERRIFHDCLDFDGELALARIAEPNPPRLDERELLCATPRATNAAIRPAEFNCVIEGPLRIGKVGNGFLECAWRLHRKHYKLNAHVCQVICYR